MKALPFFSILVIILSAIVTESLSVTIMASFILFVGYLVCQLVNTHRSRQYAFAVFNCAFVITTLLILIRYGYIVDTPDSSNLFKSGGDEDHFYELSDAVKGSNKLSDIFTNVFYFEFAENQGYIFYLRILSFLSYKLFDGNHIVLQLMGSSLFGCLISAVLFMIFNVFYDDKHSFKYSVVGFFISPLCYYSVTRYPSGVRLFIDDTNSYTTI